LGCHANRLTSLPALPNSLRYLSVHTNQLTELPALPNTLQELTAFANQLTSLPALPPNVLALTVHDNRLTSIPKLPPNLRTLSCGMNQLTTLPDLPDSLQRLYCEQNPYENPYRTLFARMDPQGDKLDTVRAFQARQKTLRAIGRNLRGIQTLTQNSKLPADVVAYMGTFRSGIPRTMAEQVRQTKEAHNTAQ
jgi:Leucine-rich repeat (LRR) protein